MKNVTLTTSCNAIDVSSLMMRNMNVWFEFDGNINDFQYEK